jgi:hypothetical protein
MRFKEFLTELFNRPYPIKVFNDQVVSKDSQGQPIYVDFDRTPSWETVRVSFDRGDKSNNRYELTGTGEEMRVFATVVAAIREWVAKYEPGMLYFGTENDEPTTRQRLYQRMVNELVPNTNYKQVFQKDADKINDETVSYWVSKLGTRFQGGTFFFLVRNDLLENLTEDIPMLEFVSSNNKELLVEYNKDITIQRFGKKMLYRYYKDSLGNSQEYTDTWAKTYPDTAKKVINNLIDEIENADPTPNKQYVPWLAKMYSEGNYGSDLEDLKSTTKDALIKFEMLKNRRQLPAPRNDIMRYTNIGDFLSVMDEYPTPNELEKVVDKGHATEIFKNNDVRIIVPQDVTAACYYGRGTRWCTASKNNNMFQSYKDSGDLFILIPTKPEYNGEKYQIHFGDIQFMNEQDRDVDPLYLITERFGNLLPIFIKIHPELIQKILFTPDEVIESVLKIIRPAILEKGSEQIADWEAGDDYYYEWLVDSGYTYPEDHELAGTIDWESVHEDPDASYLSFRDDVKSWYEALKYTADITPKEIKQLDIVRETFAEMTNLPDILSTMFSIEMGDEDYGISDYLRYHIRVLPTSAKNYALGIPTDFKVEYIYRDKKGDVHFKELKYED